MATPLHECTVAELKSTLTQGELNALPRAVMGGAAKMAQKQRLPQRSTLGSPTTCAALATWSLLASTHAARTREF
jgi:hypothetical protein